MGRILILGREHIVLTGGEPMMFPEVVSLTRQLELTGHTITIETAGTYDLSIRCHLMSISPKLSNSTPRDVDVSIINRHEANRSRPEVIRNLLARYSHQLKFVVDTPDDFSEIEQFLSQFPELAPDRVLLMPQGVTAEDLQTREPWIINYCQKHGYRYCPRMQITWYGNRRGT